MMITEVRAEDIRAQCRQVLGLPDCPVNGVEDELLTALLRRSAGILCPCSSATLRTSLMDCLRFLTPDPQQLSERIDLTIEGLTISGDLLELSQISTDDPDARGTWLFAAPPGFVIRPSGNIFLTGVVPDQELFLPHSFMSRVVYDRFTRTLAPSPGEDLAEELRDLGLQQLAEDVWLKSPKTVAPTDLLQDMARRLDSEPGGGSIDDLLILDSARPVRYYRGRWCTPQSQTGTFVARRPQAYGSPIWCFVDLQNGSAQRFVDLPLQKWRWRGCDAAWHLQMAIDHALGHPQCYRRLDIESGVRFEFYSPLPLWAERRLMVLGRSAARERSLLAYILPAAEADHEESFLQETLWLERQSDKLQGEKR